MDALTNHEIFQNAEIVLNTKDVKCKNSTWFITYFHPAWREEKDIAVAFEELEEDLKSIINRETDESYLVNAFINAEICPETGTLHFHIAATFKSDFRPLTKLKKLFEGAKILAVHARGVDCVRKYCSKRETRVGDCFVIAEDALIEAQLRKEYVDKWDGRVVKKDSVVTALEREKRLKQGRKNDAEKAKAIKTRENIVKTNRVTMKEIAGKRGEKGRWQMLKREISNCQAEIERLNLVKAGESIHGLGIESEDEEEEEVEWPEEKELVVVEDLDEGGLSREDFKRINDNLEYARTPSGRSQHYRMKIETMEEEFELFPSVMPEGYNFYLSLIDKYHEAKRDYYYQTNVWRRENGEPEIPLINGIGYRDARLKPMPLVVKGEKFPEEKKN